MDDKLQQKKSMSIHDFIQYRVDFTLSLNTVIFHLNYLIAFLST